MYLTTNYRQNYNLSKLSLLVRSYTQTTPSAFRKQVGSMDSSQSPAPISQHTISQMLYFSMYRPQNFRLASCTPTVGLENYRKVPLQNRFLILVFPVPTSPTNTILIFSQLSVLDSIIQQHSPQFLLITFMTDNNEIDFELYQLIPRDEVLRPPIPDRFADFHSKPYSQSKESSKTQDLRSEDQKSRHEKLLADRQELINQLKLTVSRLQIDLRAAQQKNSELTKLLSQIKNIIGKDHILDEEISKELESLMRKIEMATKHKCGPDISNTHRAELEQLLREKQQEIRRLRAKLLQSTANNINAILGTQEQEAEHSWKQVLQSKQNLNKSNQNSVNKLECRHEQKILNLIKSYEQMLKLYHENERSMYELKSKQEQNFAYFSSLHSQLNHSVQQVCSSYTNQRLSQLQFHINRIVENIKNAPERAKTEHEQDVRVKELLNEIQNLNERVLQREIQIEKMRESNQELMMKSRAHDRCQINIKSVEQKVKEKEKRISQLENTIIEQMDSKIRDESINSQQSDIEKQKNNVRNLKTVVNDLREQNKALAARAQQVVQENVQLKKILSSMPSSQDVFNMMEKVNRDEPSLKIVEDIVGVLISAGDGRSCKCLQLTTDCLLNISEEYPELEVVLEELGVIQKTTNLLPVQM